ncbi:winged helix DNA-binding domain-containing protein [Naasia aerilata]|uniref:Winged helix DNA-binding domain-containing protein n=1 Tax=Naasia aerilata TaxID=1162966 RepID=A0ABM8GE86_9MICO|nr:winged helix DNA-binding domain-containing protein [Naasia aerilata]BDZ46597.1 hypothetical protein GCM10025866_25060 [Naasia aerilata]
MLATQAQDFAGSLWAIALRDRAGETRADLEAALATGAIVRSWPMRGTLHLTTPDDLRMLLTVSAERTIAGTRGRRAQLGLTEEDLRRGEDLTVELLGGGRALRRPELMAELTLRGLDTTGQRAAHLLLYLSLLGVTCLGPMDGKQQAIVLLDEWAPGSAPDRLSALNQLAVRYTRSHGPITPADLAWWAGITKTEATATLRNAGGAVREIATELGPMWLAPDSPAANAPTALAAADVVRLLPPFDELLLGYTDRSANLDPAYWDRVAPGANGLFRPILSVGGRVLATWRVDGAREKSVAVDAFDGLPQERSAELETAAAEHLRFAATR